MVSGRGSANVGSEPKYCETSKRGELATSVYLFGVAGWPFTFGTGLRTVSSTCGGPPDSLLKNVSLSAVGVPSLTVEATTFAQLRNPLGRLRVPAWIWEPLTSPLP